MHVLHWLILTVFALSFGISQESKNTKETIEIVGVSDAYYLSNKHHKKPAVYFSFDRKKAFAKVFILKPYPFQSKDKFKINFKKHNIVALAKCGNALWNLKIKKVLRQKNTLAIHYQAQISKENLSWQASIPLIVVLPKTTYKQIDFIENGKKNKTLKVAKPK